MAEWRTSAAEVGCDSRKTAVQVTHQYVSHRPVKTLAVLVRLRSKRAALFG